MNILIVEDEYKELLFLTNFVRRIFPDMAIVGAVNNGKAALEAGHLHTIDLALLDIELPVHDGLYVAEQLKKSNPDLRIIILTAYSTFQYAQKALRIGVNDYLVKPYLEEELEDIIRKLILSSDCPRSLCHSFPFLPSEPEHPYTRMALHIISEQYMQNLALPALAENIKTNPDYLSKCIKKDTGMGFSELLARYRIQSAQKLLASNNYSAAQAAGLVGFSDPNYFYRCFKKYTGLSAKTYATLHLGR